MKDNNPSQVTQYFIYCRKSSEDEGKQILSLPAQEKELREHAKRFNLHIAGVYKESKTAFKPGREMFNEMLERIDAGEANGVIVWQANRIARNSLDGGRFIYMMDEGKIKELISPGRIFTNSGSDKFILNIEFGVAKKDSDDKSDNVKRGNSYKFNERKEWIGPAKPGYINYTDSVTKEKKIKIDKERFELIQRAMKLILSGSYTPMEALNMLNNEWGFRSRKTAKQGGRPMSKSGFYRLLSDPYYYGLMIRKEGQIFGHHKTMLTEDESQRLQIIIGSKGKPRMTKHEFAFKEVLKCGECGGSITAEERWQIICPVCKTKFHKGKLTTKCRECGTLIEEMKGPKLLHYIHYHCTKKIKPNCSQGSVRLELLEKQIDDELEKYEIPETFRAWAIEHLNELDENEVAERHTVRNTTQEALQDTMKKLDALTKLYISPQNTNHSLLTEEEYKNQREPLLIEKRKLAQLTADVDQRQDNWHDLAINTFNFACYARHAFATGDLKTKTQILGALGSDLVIKDKNLQVLGMEHWFLIKKGKEDLVTLAKKLEPTKWMELLGQSDLPKVFRSTWLRG